MKLDYFTLLCPEPISLSIGTIKQPTLRDIGKITFSKFNMFQVYLKLKPSDYYEKINELRGKSEWDSLTDEQKSHITLFDVILVEDIVRLTYLEIFNFFFVERVIFRENLFVIVKTDDYDTPSNDLNLSDENVKGVISNDNLLSVLDILQQICCIKSDDALDENKPVFKNKKAKRLYEKMLKAKATENKKVELKDYYNLKLPNIISATAMKSHGLNIINIWDTTLFQLYDQFKKLQNDDSHYMNAVRVAVWGDEKNQFDPSLWYKNTYDKQNNKGSI